VKFSLEKKKNVSLVWEIIRAGEAPIEWQDEKEKNPGFGK